MRTFGHVCCFLLFVPFTVCADQPASSLSSENLVEQLRQDPEALDLIREDSDLLGQLNRKPVLSEVIRELRSDPGKVWFRIQKTLRDPWIFFGFFAQFLFFMRFLIQWISSEKKKRSHVPVAFWYFSLAGGMTLFVYALHRMDPVFMFGQGLGCVIYLRNLALIRKRMKEHQKRLADRSSRATESA